MTDKTIDALFSAIRKSHAYSGGHGFDGEYVKLLFRNSEDRHAFLDAYVIAISTSDARRAALRRMTEMDEEMEVKHPGWMGGGSNKEDQTNG